MRTASDQFLPYFPEYDTNLMDAFNLVDCGDVPIVPGNPVRSREVVKDYVGRVLDSDALAICCGGDHSLPIAIGAALAERLPNFGYLHLDAHLDAAQDVAGERCTNWSAVSRMAELIDPRKIAVVGVRGLANPPEQFRFVADRGIHLHTMRNILDRGIDATILDALEAVTDGTDGFYVSWDLDVIDPAFAPGTNGNEPGGITSREALRAAQLIGTFKPRILEIAELIPVYDPTFITAKLACYLVFNVLGAMAVASSASVEASVVGGV
jgi:agmatinase